MLNQYAIELLMLSVSSGLIVNFLKKFNVGRDVYATVLLPLFVFVAGYSLRLSGDKEMIDIGYFFTDFSFLFVYIVFAISFLLGQIKYWKIGQKN